MPTIYEVLRDGKVVLTIPGKYSAALLGCCMKLGVNPGGREVRDKNAHEASLKRDRENAMSPADREKRSMLEAIAKAENRAQRCDRSQDDVEYRHRKWAAEELLEAFYAKYPEELAAKKAADLRWKASELRRKAVGALLYDADGWIGADEQQRSHDAMIAEAVEIEKQADEISPVDADLDGEDDE